SPRAPSPRAPAKPRSAKPAAAPRKYEARKDDAAPAAKPARATRPAWTPVDEAIATTPDEGARVKKPRWKKTPEKAAARAAAKAGKPAAGKAGKPGKPGPKGARKPVAKG
ncbi:MAG: hypothetical protein Q4G26_15995, partial [Paracoccus sp. (in: a-proteobacteria)]|nr:hypothetical protein [Paracoccus sp. (in: a-proteobacteria)]